MCILKHILPILQKSLFQQSSTIRSLPDYVCVYIKVRFLLSYNTLGQLTVFSASTHVYFEGHLRKILLLFWTPMLQISLSSFRSTTLLNNFFIPNYLNLSPAIQAHSPEFTFPTSLSVSPFNPFQRKAADLLEDFSHAHSSQFLLIAFVKGTNLSKGEVCSLRTGKLYHVLLKGQLLSG